MTEASPGPSLVTDDVMITAGMLADRLRPLVLAACDGDPPDRFGSSCLNGTPMIPLHRATVTAVYGHLERLAALDGETTDRAREYPKTHDVRSQNIPVLGALAARPLDEGVVEAVARLEAEVALAEKTAHFLVRVDTADVRAAIEALASTPNAVGLVEAAENLSNFAWSIVTTDGRESGLYLQSLIDNLREALARFRSTPCLVDGK